MNAKELAEKLNGRTEGNGFISQQEIHQALHDGLVIVIGASDDLIEFLGAIHDEGDCYEGGIIKIDESGIVALKDYGDLEDFEEMRRYVERVTRSKSIEAIWSDHREYCWTYKTDIPHECFDLMADDDQIYCRGIVFSIESLKPFQPDLKSALESAVKALYFNDSADYETALYDVVQHIGGLEAINLLAKDRSAAFEKYCNNKDNQ